MPFVDSYRHPHTEALRVQLSPQSETTFTGSFGWGIRFVTDSEGVTTHLLEMHISGNYRFAKTK